MERKRKKKSRENADKTKTIMSIFDIHGKSRHKPTIRIFRKIAKELNPDIIVFGGDNEDFDGISRFTAKNINKGMKEAIEERKWFTKNIYEPIIKDAGNPEVYICLGNHDGQRVEDVISKMRERDDNFRADSFEEKIDPKKFFKNAKICSYNQYHKIGKILFTHGTYHGLNHAKKHADVFGTNVCYGHIHTHSVFTRTNLGISHESVSMPCACDLNPSYMKQKQTSWVNGFGIHYILPNGNFQTYVVKVINNKTIWNGKIYK